MVNRRPYHPKNPLPGISPAPTTALGNQAVVPSGHGGRRVTLFYRAFAPTGAGAKSHPTANYSLLTANSLTYTFSAKEKDSETGLSYFGSRYYSSDLSIWLSVDPMSDKYPSLSPYVYCADNPVRVVDPDGEEVVIILGEYMKESDRQQALNDLRNAAPNLNLELDGDKLVVGDGGTAKTKYEEKLLGAISSSIYKSEITLELNETAGSYMGTDLIAGQYVSKNSVNPYKMKEIEEETRSVRGCGLMHEITEGFEMGKIAKRENLTHIDKAWRKPGQMTVGERNFPNDEVGSQYHLYEEGHSLATPQPGDWRAKPKRFFDEQ